MKISIHSITSIGIRNEMEKDSYTTAELLGTFTHPDHPSSSDWTVRLYRAADQLVFETNGDPVWENDTEGFAVIVRDYGINMDSVISE
jgi:hypothetical protein